MDKDEFLNDVMKEWEYKVDDGMPDVTNEYHLQILGNILRDKGSPENFIYEYLTSIRQLNETDEDTSFNSGSYFVLDTDYKKTPEEEDEEAKEVEPMEDPDEDLVETYIFDNTEVVKTGRKAIKGKEQKQKRSSRTPSNPDILYEVTPADTENGTWKKWVRHSDLYEIIGSEH